MSSQKNIGKLVVGIILVAGFAVFAAQQKSTVSGGETKLPSRGGTVDVKEKPAPVPIRKSPRLVDLGAKSCVPCKMMAPILEELRNEYRGRLQVDFIDVWKDPAAAERYRIRIIPTQIFLDSSGKELFRHQGFMSKEDILAKWKELGCNLTAAQ